MKCGGNGSKPLFIRGFSVGGGSGLIDSTHNVGGEHTLTQMRPLPPPLHPLNLNEAELNHDGAFADGRLLVNPF